MSNGNLRESTKKIDLMSHENNDNFKKIMNHFDLCHRTVADLMGVPRSFTSNWRRRKYSFRGGRDGEAQGKEHRYKEMSHKYFALFQSTIDVELKITKEMQNNAIQNEELEE